MPMYKNRRCKMPYKNRGPVKIKTFSCSSAENLENSMNEWLGHQARNVIDISYQHCAVGNGESYSSFVTYTDMEREESM